MEFSLINDMENIHALILGVFSNTKKDKRKSDIYMGCFDAPSNSSHFQAMSDKYDISLARVRQIYRESLSEMKRYLQSKGYRKAQDVMDFA
jgi:hypothetical protein